MPPLQKFDVNSQIVSWVTLVLSFKSQALKLIYDGQDVIVGLSQIAGCAACAVRLEE